MLTINDFSFSGKKALIRVDFNVPLNALFQITDDSRMRAAVPTIKKILSDGGSAILMSHLGRPKGGYEEKYSLKHLVPHLSNLLKVNALFAEDCTGGKTLTAAADLRPGEVLLLENLRFHKEEEKGDEAFAKKLSLLGDFYINDAFGTAHRAHASTTIIARFFPAARCCGMLMAKEIECVEKVLTHAERPFTAIMGGAKVSDKILLIEQLMQKTDNLLIGGGMAYTFAKALGGSVGNSLVEEEKISVARNILETAKKKGVTIVLPKDSVIADAFSETANTKVCDNNCIPDSWMGLDIGTDARESFTTVIKQSKTILWNGPMGVFEIEKFAAGTKIVADAIVAATASGAFSLIGGGDSAAAINKLGLGDKVSYVSTGGGALLEYIEGKQLPGIKAILES